MATIREVAQAAGVSAGAVSRILNNDQTLNVTDDTRQKVLETAKALGYNNSRKNTKNLKSKFILGIVQWFTPEDELNDNYYLRARQGIEDFCLKNSLGIVRVFHGDSDGLERLKNVNGLICLGKFSNEDADMFAECCNNIVFLDMQVENRAITSLSMDFNQAVIDALNYLTENGHTRIGFLCGQEYVGSGEKLEDPRATAFRNYMTYFNLEYKDWYRFGSFSSQSGFDMMKEMINSGNLPTAIFAASDSIAIGAMRAIHEAGLRIPEDISIIGFNDEDNCKYLNPPLTTISAPSYDMGQHGANLVYVASNLSNHTPLKALIPCKLIVRESVRDIR